ncbi:MAG: GAF domain-containing protein [Bacteroidales bacterium]|nr:GAF domain-containing protein [Bacteroidales bacterium]
MAEDIVILGNTKEEKYENAFLQIKALLNAEKDLIASMANTAAVLHFAFGFFWTGFYRVDGEELVLGPFQGPLACMRIKKGRGVCGTAWQEKRTVLVDDVEKFKGHIACSSLSKSEIVVPLVKDGQVQAVLDIDSDKYSFFDLTDKKWLERIAELFTL